MAAGPRARLRPRLSAAHPRGAAGRSRRGAGRRQGHPARRRQAADRRGPGPDPRRRRHPQGPRHAGRPGGHRTAAGGAVRARVGRAAGAALAAAARGAGGRRGLPRQAARRRRHAAALHRTASETALVGGCADHRGRHGAAARARRARPGAGAQRLLLARGGQCLRPALAAAGGLPGPRHRRPVGARRPDRVRDPGAAARRQPGRDPQRPGRPQHHHGAGAPARHGDVVCLRPPRGAARRGPAHVPPLRAPGALRAHRAGHRAGHRRAAVTLRSRLRRRIGVVRLPSAADPHVTKP
ncbi:hypothetical protein SCOCK_250076 [Actinacidiphila cocklensis]|uniref:Uncharacterized protein n=1 Tax=Actinacidiphila cocklensis TaxID=887465 RepID=A0A9W4DUM2_9ACTN|nr:hypothetical protein SCOCK_250076 [Actinacidiphila cocklensis]